MLKVTKGMKGKARKWQEIVRKNQLDYYYETIGNRKVLVVAVHAVGLNFPIACVVDGRLLTDEDIEPSQQSFDAFFKAAMVDADSISVSDGGTIIDAVYTTSIRKLKQQFMGV
jgi:hypothetical protein